MVDLCPGVFRRVRVADPTCASLQDCQRNPILTGRDRDRCASDIPELAVGPQRNLAKAGVIPFLHGSRCPVDRGNGERLKMFAKLKGLIGRPCLLVAHRIAGWAVRLGGFASSRVEIPDYDGSDLEEAAPFAGTPEEAMILLQLPPMGVYKRRAIARVSKSGKVQGYVEEWKLTKRGKIARRTDFVLLDDQGKLGAPEQLKGQCSSCGGFIFQAQGCNGCGVLICHACARTSEGDRGEQYLCARCHRSAVLNKDNWAAHQENQQPHEDNE
jgi:hypothetical protein